MSQKDKGLRVRRTQKLLREALIELIEERGFDALTVGEIAERAMVSRAAFYRNYQDKYDLVEQIFQEAMQALFDAVSEPVTEHPPQIWVRFFEHVGEYERLYKALLGRKGSPWFVFKMRASLQDLFKQYVSLPMWQFGVNRPLGPLVDEFIMDMEVTMVVEAITWWLEKGRPFSPQEMATRCVQIAGAVHHEVHTWE